MDYWMNFVVDPIDVRIQGHANAKLLKILRMRHLFGSLPVMVTAKSKLGILDNLY